MSAVPPEAAEKRTSSDVRDAPQPATITLALLRSSFYVIRLPHLLEERLFRTVKAQDDEVALAGDGSDPVSVLVGRYIGSASKWRREPDSFAVATSVDDLEIRHLECLVVECIGRSIEPHRRHRP